MLHKTRPKKNWYQRLSIGWTVGAALVDSLFASDTDYDGYHSEDKNAIGSNMPVMIGSPEIRKEKKLSFEKTDEGLYGDNQFTLSPSYAGAPRPPIPSNLHLYNKQNPSISATDLDSEDQNMHRSYSDESELNQEPSPHTMRYPGISLLSSDLPTIKESSDRTNEDNPATSWTLTLSENGLIHASQLSQSNKMFDTLCNGINNEIDKEDIQTVAKSHNQTKLPIGHCLIDTAHQTIYAHELQVACSNGRGGSVIHLKLQAPENNSHSNAKKRLNHFITELRSPARLERSVSSTAIPEVREKNNQKKIIKASLNSFHRPKVTIAKICNSLDDLETVIGSLCMITANAADSSQDIAFDLTGVKLSGSVQGSPLGRQMEYLLQTHKRKDSDKKAIIVELQSLLGAIQNGLAFYQQHKLKSK